MMDLFLINKSFSFHKVLIEGLESCGSLMDYYVFISFWTHSDGTHSQRISDIILKFSKKHTTCLRIHFQLFLGELLFL